MDLRSSSTKQRMLPLKGTLHEPAVGMAEALASTGREQPATGTWREHNWATPARVTGGLVDTEPTRTDKYLCCVVLHRFHNRFSQSQRRPLLVPV